MIIDSLYIKPLLTTENINKNKTQKKLLTETNLNFIDCNLKCKNNQSNQNSPFVELKNLEDIKLTTSNILDLEKKNCQTQILDTTSTIDIFENEEFFDNKFYAKSQRFLPNIGWFGAPTCRWTSSVMSLIGIMSGVVIATSGVCILVFFLHEEPTIWPLGVTLGVVGMLLLFIGLVMWTSEFFCNDCLGRAHKKIKEAPLKNAIKRQSRMANREVKKNLNLSQISNLRTKSELSNISYRGSNATDTSSLKY